MGNTQSRKEKKVSKCNDCISISNMKIGSKYKWLTGGFKRGLKMTKCATLKKKKLVNTSEYALEFDIGLKNLYKTRERKTRKKFLECSQR